MFDIGKGTNTPIKGLEFFKLPNTTKFAIFVATPLRLYFFCGATEPDEKPLLQQVFNRYLNIPEQDTYIEVESKLKNANNKSNYAKLKFWSANLSTPNSLAWMTEESVVHIEVLH